MAAAPCVLVVAVAAPVATVALLLPQLSIPYSEVALGQVLPLLLSRLLLVVRTQEAVVEALSMEQVVPAAPVWSLSVTGPKL